jgi:hypothetical protein
VAHKAAEYANVDLLYTDLAVLALAAAGAGLPALGTPTPHPDQACWLCRGGPRTANLQETETNNTCATGSSNDHHQVHDVLDEAGKITARSLLRACRPQAACCLCLLRNRHSRAAQTQLVHRRVCGDSTVLVNMQGGTHGCIKTDMQAFGVHQHPASSLSIRPGSHKQLLRSQLS